MSKRILYLNPNEPHNLILVCPAYSGADRLERDTDEDVLRKAIDRLKEVGKIDGGTALHVVEEAEIPEDHTLFNAWVWDNGIKIDQAKAKRLGLT
jgi:hypothetical protein|tara:strand:- start:1264 stop:1548 length:285 start_codon:yes stop_codon:yes gene_type:complete